MYVALIQLQKKPTHTHTQNTEAYRSGIEQTDSTETIKQNNPVNLYTTNSKKKSPPDGV